MPSREEITARVAHLVGRRVRRQEEDPRPDQVLADYGVDSLDRIDIAMDVEEEFGITVTDEESDNVQTVNDIVALVIAKQAVAA